MNEDKRKERPQEAEQKEQPPKPPKTGGNKVLFFGILGGVVVLNALVAFMLVQFTRPKPRDEIESRLRADSLRQVTEAATTMGATTEEAIEAVVNIAGTEGERFLKAGILLEYDNKVFPALGEELARRAPKFKSLLIDHLSKLTLMEVTEPDAKEKIRKDLLRVINASLPTTKIGEVRDVFFATYIIQ